MGFDAFAIGLQRRAQSVTVVRGLRLGALGVGAGYALYGFRAAAMGQRLTIHPVAGAA